MKTVVMAKGFRFAGIHAGVKVARKDLALIVSNPPACAAGVVTRNTVRAPCVERVEALLPSDNCHAVVVSSGIANAVTGPEGKEHDQRMAAAAAKTLNVPADGVISATTGAIGTPLPIDLLEEAMPKLVEALGEDIVPAAEAILTTDRVIKLASATLDIDGQSVRITGLAKGSGMIHPNMATMLAYVCTDAKCDTQSLSTILTNAADETFNQISVDRDTSTNDMTLLLANGASGVEVTAETEVFVDGVRDVCRDLARQIAADGEGSTRLISLQVSGAPDLETARTLSRAAICSSLFKASVYGDHSGAERCLAAIGASASEAGVTLREELLHLQVNGTAEIAEGKPTGAKGPMTGPEVVYEVNLGLGDADAWAWGCDLTYGYVSINAVSKSEPLQTHSPGLKRRLLVEALSYIQRFSGRLAVIKYGGAAMIRDDLKDAFAEDLVLLKASGLLPVVVHGGGPEISRMLDLLGQETNFIDGIRVTDDSSIKVVEMVLTGSVNTDVVTRVQKHGGRAIGLSGKDGGLLQARKLEVEGRDYGLVGEIESIQTDVVRMLLKEDYIPVISPIGVDEHGRTYNINADDVAAQIAIALGAYKLLYLTDVSGIQNGEEVISRTTPEEMQRLVDEKVVTGGMLPKVHSLLSAIEGGVTSGHIIDGRVPHNLLAELFTDNGVGTWITLDP